MEPREDLHPALKKNLGERGRAGTEVAPGGASLTEARDGHGGPVAGVAGGRAQSRRCQVAGSKF